MTHAESVTPVRSTEHPALRGAYGIADLPYLIEVVAELEPQRVAVRHEDAAITYAELSAELSTLAEAMGDALTPDALVQVVVSGRLPELLESGEGALAAAVSDLLDDALTAAADVLDPGLAPADTLATLFAEQVRRTPGLVAVEFDGRTLTYAELDARANALAWQLVRLGVGPDTRVGVSMHRSLELVIGMYAIHKAGGAYVPIDPEHPADRIAYVLEIAAPVVVLTHAASPSFDGVPVLRVDEFDWETGEPASVLEAEEVVPARPDNIAYVIFTSGSTGRPKGVAVSHRAIVANLRWRQRCYRMHAADVVLQKTPFTFDVSVWEFFWPLQVGARLVLAAPDGHRDPAYLIRTIAAKHVTIAHFVPSMLAVFAAAVADAQAMSDIDSLRAVFASGEALPAATGAAFRDVSGASLHNLYGPTEAAVDVTAHEVTAADTVSVPIGAAADDTDLHVLDDNLQPVPDGVVGELYLSGVQLARGYLGRAALTAERFVANPHGAPGDRMYRTGDLVRWNSGIDGGPRELEYLGRSDFQVKLRGLRIELGEVEAALLAHESVAQAAVVLYRHSAGDHLIGYVVAAGGCELDSGSILGDAAGRLPEYMVPSLLVAMDRMPVNANGKLDRKALPEPEFGSTAGEFRAPETAGEQAVAEIFADLLGIDTVGADDDFFARGGNSLLATRAIARISAALDIAVDVRDFFDRPTPAGLAALATPARVRPPLVAGPRPETVPLSAAQRRMWFLNRLANSDATGNSAAAVDNIPVALRLRGRLDTAALRAAVADVTARHEVLRTVYPQTAAGAVQVVRPVAEPELAPVEVAEADLVAAVREAAATGFDVAAEIPVRVRLLRTGADDHTLVLVVHHIAADGVSMGPLLRDLIQAYTARSRGTAPGWTPLPLHYADYTLWQRRVLGDDTDPDSEAARQLAFWQRELADLPAQLDLPADRPRPAAASYRGATVEFAIDAGLRAAIDELADQLRATPFMVLHATLSLLLARLSGTSDIAIGTPVAGRGERALDDLVGMFVNTLVLRTRVAGDADFAELVRRTRAVDLDAFAHAEIPFERLVEVLNPARSQARHPLFQVGLFMQNIGVGAPELPGLETELVDFDPGFAKFDLQLTISAPPAADGGYRAEFTYATDLFDAPTVEEFAAKFLRLLGGATAHPHLPVGDLELLDAGELDYVTSSWNASGHKVFDHFLHEGFDRQSRRTPNNRALVFEGAELTYGEMSDRVNRLARKLIESGVGPETLVVLAMPRSIELVLGMYAVLHAGGAYVPVDPSHPIERIGHILATARPHTVLTTRAAGFELPPTASDTAVVHLDELDLADYSAAAIGDRERRGTLHPDHPAYVLFTSGSTGRPKGVAVSHRAIANQLEWMHAEYGVRAADIYLQKTATTFDVSLWGYFLPLRAGATLILAAPDGHRDARYLAETIAAQRVTLTDFVPSMLTVFLNHAEADELTTLRAAFVVGEALPAETAALFAEKCDGALHNLYGPTEAAVSITCHEVTPDDVRSVPIGEPEWNSQVFVLDARLHPAPIGVPGELYLAGAQLARGYCGRADLTADRFVANPFAVSNRGTPEGPAGSRSATASGPAGRAPAGGERMYRTGDLVRWTPEGELDYLGRIDFQVKFRGQRIELPEIETALLAAPGVGQAAVRLITGESGDYLAGYVIRTPGAELDVQAVREGLGAVLPAYMIPTAVVELTEFPLNSSGKLDRAALPLPVLAAAEFHAPRTPLEERVAAVFADVLGLERVGRDDDFFALGGSSLDATQVSARVGRIVDARVPVRTLFEASTVAAFAAAVGGDVAERARPALVKQRRPQRIPLSPAQQRMWFLNRFDPESGVHNIPVAVRLSGALDVAALAAAVADVVERHETLRTRYPEYEDGPAQDVLPAADVRVDLTPVGVPASQIAGRIAALTAQGFDVTAAPPLRIALLRSLFDDGSAARSESAEPEHVLVFVAHHIAADGWSIAPLTRDLMTAYAHRAAGTAPQWEPLPVQYADFSIWQHAVLGSESDPDSVLGAQAAYWRAALAGLADELNLPTDRPRPMRPSHAGGRVRFEIGGDIRDGLRELAQRRHATTFMAVHTALAIFLARMAGTDDVAIGSPIAGRGERELDDLIGMFVNTVVLRTAVSGGASFTELLDRTRDADLRAFAHADLPFERLVELLDPERSTARHPLFQVALAFENLPTGALELPGLRVGTVDPDAGTAKFDLALNIRETADGMSAEFAYARDLFDHVTIEGFANRFLGLLRQLVADPEAAVGDMSLLSADEYVRLTRVRPDEVMATALLPELLTAGLGLGRDRIAVRYEGRSITYGDLDDYSSRLARRLIAAGVGPEQLVAVALPRSFEMVAAAMAVAKAGGAHVPVDPTYPAERVRYMVTDSAARVGITVAAYADALPEGVRWLVLDAPATEAELAALPAGPVGDAERLATLRMSHPAYVIYTSGSTGMPKGVTVTHAGLGGLAQYAIERYGLRPEHRMLHVCSPSFDPSVLEWICAFATGATLVIVPARVIGGPELGALLRTERVTHAIITPAVLGTLDAAEQPQLQVLSVGGDVTTDELLAAWEPGRRYFNGYGPTETTIISSYARLSAGHPVTIGTPVHGMSALVLDARLRPVAPGVAGELYLAGGGLARGYRNRSGGTAERFVPNPWGTPGSRMYRTGDVVRWRAIAPTVRQTQPEWELEYVGRSDFQVKIRGFRVELGEIDAVLGAHPDVDYATTLGRDHDTRGTMLVSYVLPKPGRAIDPVDLTDFAARRLPSHMVPAALVVLDKIPLTPVGKLDRKALPEPVLAPARFRAPVGAAEVLVANTFAALLGVEQVGADDDFFALGGNSLIATQLAARLNKATGGTVPVRAVFDAPTVRALATRITLSDNGSRDAGPTAVVPRPEIVPLSIAQQRMWMLNRLDTGGGSYNIAFALRLTGNLHVAALRAAIADVIERHETLRTRYPERDGAATQFVLPAAVPDLAVTDVDAAEVAAMAETVAHSRFDVADEVPVRIRLLRVRRAPDADRAAQTHVLLFVVHHIAADGWSFAPLTKDLAVAYQARTEGAAPQWSPLPIQYADYALWQQRTLGSAADPHSESARQLEFWRTQLSGAPELSALPTDRPRPAIASQRGGARTARLSAALHQRIHDLAAAHRVTPFMVLHAALSVLLARFGGSDDIVIGAPVAGRGDQALDDLVGMFVNTLVLRTPVHGEDSLAEHLNHVRAVDLAAFDHAAVPFEQLVEVLNPARSRAYSPLYQVSLTLQNQTRAQLRLDGLEIAAVEPAAAPIQVDQHWTANETYAADGTAAGIDLHVHYAADLFEPETVAALLDGFERIVAAMTADGNIRVADVELMSPAERDRLIGGHNATGYPVGPRTLPELLAARPQRPAAQAVTFEGTSLSYREFDRRVHRLARYLIGRGVGPDTAVAVSVPRSLELVVAIHAIVAAGAAYVPLDPDHPADRVRYVLDTARPDCVLTTTDVPGLPAGVDAVRLDRLELSGYADDAVTDADRVSPLRPEHVAYVIFTSGSTGRPKGVAVSHGAIVNRLVWMQSEYRLGADDVVLQKTPATFDVSVWEFFWPLQVGARLVVARPDGHRDPAYLARVMDEEAVTTAHFVPSMLAVFVGSVAAAPESLRRVFTSGEALTADTAARWRELGGAPLHNLYGPTEAAVDVTFHEVTEADTVTVPIGRPVANTRVYVLDSTLRPVPVGVTGELYLAGDQLARGYVGRPESTSDRFVADPFAVSDRGTPEGPAGSRSATASGPAGRAPAGARMYRTGDLVRWNRAGELEYLGRNDFQVKLRGLRIELGEIEAALTGRAGVAQAAVVVAGAGERARLHAYVVPAADASVDSAAVLAAAGRALPAYMVPSGVTVLAQLPVNSSGKLDRAALPAVDPGRSPSTAPRPKAPRPWSPP
ncbi:non-ribosomal peptide synthetase [Nocardia africana]|uniref:Tyrocidine synthase III n=1 Tax=Nocardia africana TaxID=134964 RepID=A0A378X6G3_9NOCA|nr:non-ribosomal peptide synthetase [Nocardia africana]SUA48133.1 Tyrocidine synthase III [Nocardia africana]